MTRLRELLQVGKLILFNMTCRVLSIVNSDEHYIVATNKLSCLYCGENVVSCIGADSDNGVQITAW